METGTFWVCFYGAGKVELRGQISGIMQEIMPERTGAEGMTDFTKGTAAKDGGQIVDIGTHDELMSHPGKYAAMWGRQAQWYEKQSMKANRKV